jgi:hypothetical protein
MLSVNTLCEKISISVRRIMADHKVEFHWVRGFVEKFTCEPLAKTAETWYNQGMSLDSVVRVLITTNKGEVLYDVKKESPYVTSQKADGTGSRTKKKKTVRKAARTKIGQ